MARIDEQEQQAQPRSTGRTPRIPLPTPEEMTPEQRRVHDEVISGPRGQIIGPLRAAILSPDLALRWSRLGEFLRYGTAIPAHYSELAIIVTARRWTSQIEWWVHARVAAEAGVPQAVIDAIGAGEAPTFDDPDEAAVYEFTRQLQVRGETDLEIYRLIQQRWGAQGIVELAAIIGYYTMVAMTLNVHEIPLPDGVEPPLSRLEGDDAGMFPKGRQADRPR